MRRYTVLVALVLAFAVVSVAIAGPAQLVRLKGWIVDEEGGRAHANAESVDLVKAAHEGEKPLVFLTNDGKTYAIENPERAIDYVGKEVTVVGQLADDKLTVGSALTPIQPAD